MIHLQVAGFLEHSTVNGLGLRSVLFLSGCPHNCLGCQNQAMQAYDYGEQTTIDTALTRILKNKPLIDGVTFSGGEPFEQSKALLPLAKKIKAEGLNLWCYTGYTYEQLLLDADKNALLKQIDVLVDGPFQINYADKNLKFRGSSNQHIYALENGVIQTILDNDL